MKHSAATFNATECFIFTSGIRFYVVQCKTKRREKRISTECLPVGFERFSFIVRFNRKATAHESGRVFHFGGNSLVDFKSL